MNLISGHFLRESGRDMGNKTKQKDIRIIVGVPCQDLMKSSTAHAIGCAILGNPQIVDFLIYKGCDIVSSRTWLVQEAIKKGATHLLFVDSDMVFPSQAIEQLLSHGKEIIAVDYNKRKFPLESVLTQLNQSEKCDDKPYRVAVAGTGLMLIDLSIFDKIGKPWFNFGRGSEGQLKMGEDAWFCYTAREAGVEVWVDPTMRIFHSGEYLY